MSQASEPVRGQRNGEERGALKSHADNVATDFSELRADIAKLASALGRIARSEAGHVGERVSALTATARSRADEGVHYVSDRVRERPVAALGITLGAGVLLGLALGLGRRR